MMQTANTITRTAPQKRSFDASLVRRDFPGLAQQVASKPLVYLDSAATAQKPRVVLDAMRRADEFDCANIHRGVHELSQRATAAYEGVRETVRRFINAPKRQEIIFVRGATEAINLVAYSFGRSRCGPGDEIVISAMEHHSNIVPWQLLCKETGAVLKVIPMNDRGELLVDEYKNLLTAKTKLVALVHVSNALGTINPVREMISLARDRGIPTLLDGAQALPHMRVDVQDLDCDFYAFSGHKLYGPTGIGVLYGKQQLLEAMPPFQGGGDMIRTVTFEGSTFAGLPHKFEAGTPNITGTIGLGAAIDYLEGFAWDEVIRHENDLLAYAHAALAEIPGVRFIGEAQARASVISFLLDDIHPHDIGTIVDREGIAIRAGHHCAQPVMSRFGISASARASFGLYNTRDDVDALVLALHKVRALFKHS